MSRPDSCYDNAFMESCFGTIKSELEMDCYENERVARAEMRAYIRYYNTSKKGDWHGLSKIGPFEVILLLVIGGVFVPICAFGAPRMVTGHGGINHVDS